jgi:hypothetical protein
MSETFYGLLDEKDKLVFEKDGQLVAFKTAEAARVACTGGNRPVECTATW